MLTNHSRILLFPNRFALLRVLRGSEKLLRAFSDPDGCGKCRCCRPVIVPYDTGIRDIHVSQSIHLPLDRVASDPAHAVVYAWAFSGAK
jgi:hypothetical protein